MICSNTIAHDFERIMAIFAAIADMEDN